MRRLLGLLVLLYGLLLALNTAAPSLAELAGRRVSVRLSGTECTAPLGTPPFGGLYGNCSVTWAGSQDGRLFGAEVSERLVAGAEVTAHKYPMLRNYAVLPPSNSDQVIAIISILIIIIGVSMAQADRKPTRGKEEDDNTEPSAGGNSGPGAGGNSGPGAGGAIEPKTGLASDHDAS